MVRVCAELGIPKSVNIDRDPILRPAVANPRSSIQLGSGFGDRQRLEILPNDQDCFEQGHTLATAQSESIGRIDSFLSSIEKSLGLQVCPPM